MQISLAASVVNDGGVYLAMLMSTPKQIPLSVSGLGDGVQYLVIFCGHCKAISPFFSILMSDFAYLETVSMHY